MEENMNNQEQLGGMPEQAVCSNCGAPIGEEQAFCPKCGTPKGQKKSENKCGKCGAPLQEGQEFCPKCGQKAGLAVDSTVSSAINSFNASVDKKKSKKKFIPIILAVVAIAVIGVVVWLRGPSVDEIVLSKDSIELKVDASQSVTYTISPAKAADKKVEWSSSNESVAKVDSNGNITGKGDGSCTITVTAGGKSDTIKVTVKSGPDFKSIFNQYCKDDWADLASDGSYLSIDTNSKDEDDYIDYDAYFAIDDVIKALGLPESLYEDMGHTSSADGKQTEDYDDVTVSWKYHPDYGMEVTFKAK